MQKSFIEGPLYTDLQIKQQFSRLLCRTGAVGVRTYNMLVNRWVDVTPCHRGLRTFQEGTILLWFTGMFSCFIIFCIKFCLK